MTSRKQDKTKNIPHTTAVVRFSKLISVFFSSLAGNMPCRLIALRTTRNKTYIRRRKRHVAFQTRLRRSALEQWLTAAAATCVNQKMFTPTCPNKWCRTQLTGQQQRLAVLGGSASGHFPSLGFSADFHSAQFQFSACRTFLPSAITG